MDKRVLKEFKKQMYIATGLCLVTLPYILVTNYSSTALILVHAFLMWLITPIFMTTVELYRQDKRFKKNNSIHMAIVLTTLAVALSSLITVGIFHQLSNIDLKLLFSPPLFAALLPVFFGYLFILFSQTYKEQKEFENKLKEERNKASFVALSSQLKPHFLFNTLNTIEYLIETSPEEAKNCLHQLSELYRNILDSAQHNLVSLSSEIEQVKKYLKIQEYRFEGKLQVIWDCDSSILNQSIPPNLILNCVENSCKHGVEAIKDSKPIYINIQDFNSIGYKIKIENYHGNTEINQNRNRKGFGLEDVKTRIDLLYQGKASMELNKTKDRFEIIFILPKG